VPFSSSVICASAAVDIDSINSARTVSSFDLVGYCSGRKSAPQGAKKFWVEGEIVEFQDDHRENRFYEKPLVGQRGFEPQSKRPKRSRIDQATLLSRSVALTY